MASRPGFYIKNNQVTSISAEFEWAGGFAISQKKKNVARLHSSLGSSCLEVSTKSDIPLGIKLSAFNLKLDGNALENVFQSSKVFSNSGPYLDLLTLSPKEAKRDERLKSGNLIGFKYNGYNWPLIPKTCFYDYLYCKAVNESINFDELKQIQNYMYFTDIEFNPNKSINTQARSIAIVKLMIDIWGKVLDLSPEQFIELHSRFVKE